MKYKVLGGIWGEGHKAGDIVDMDWDAAKRRIELGELEAYQEPVPSAITDVPAPEVPAPEFVEPPMDLDIQHSNPAQPIKDETAKFCDFCDSKGGRHKRDCTRPAPTAGVETPAEEELVPAPAAAEEATPAPAVETPAEPSVEPSAEQVAAVENVLTPQQPE